MEKQLVLYQNNTLVKNQKTFPAAYQDFMAMILAIVQNAHQINLIVISLFLTVNASARTILLTNALHATHADLMTQSTECANRTNAKAVSIAK